MAIATFILVYILGGYINVRWFIEGYKTKRKMADLVIMFLLWPITAIDSMSMFNLIKKEAQDDSKKQ